jgi:hypothetical protein
VIFRHRDTQTRLDVRLVLGFPQRFPISLRDYRDFGGPCRGPVEAVDSVERTMPEARRRMPAEACRHRRLRALRPGCSALTTGAISAWSVVFGAGPALAIYEFLPIDDPESVCIEQVSACSPQAQQPLLPDQVIKDRLGRIGPERAFAHRGALQRIDAVPAPKASAVRDAAMMRRRSWRLRRRAESAFLDKSASSSGFYALSVTWRSAPTARQDSLRAVGPGIDRTATFRRMRTDAPRKVRVGHDPLYKERAAM